MKEKSLCVVEGDRIGDQQCYNRDEYLRVKKRKREGTWSFFDCRVTEFDDRGAPATAEPPYLPPSESNKPTLVLDLDNTLVSCMLDHIGSEKSGRSCSSYVAKRPGVDEFLRSMAEHYEVVLWTGSRKRYADAVVEVLPDVFSHRLYKVDKKLASLGREMKKVVMVDDCRNGGCPEVDNLIVISHYVHDGQHEEDTKLKEIGDMLLELAPADDFRDGLRKLKKDGVLDKIGACFCKRR